MINSNWHPVSFRSYCRLLFKLWTFCIFEPLFGGLRDSVLCVAKRLVRQGLIVWQLSMMYMWCMTEEWEAVELVEERLVVSTKDGITTCVVTPEAWANLMMCHLPSWTMQQSQWQVYIMSPDSRLSVVVALLLSDWTVVHFEFWTLTSIFTQNLSLVFVSQKLYSVHIIVQRANWYIVAFHIAISYDIYLSDGRDQATQMVGTLVLYWWVVTGGDVESADASTCKRSFTEFLESEDLCG